MMRILLPLFALLLLLGGPAQSSRAEDIDLSEAVKPDPAITRMVTLPNGFTYWIRPHAIPGRVVEMALHVAVGSLHEEEHERGLAHFLEHMAFNGSKNFPPGEVIKFFESQGLTFGQHQNANTAFARTKYFLSLSNNANASVEKALTFFADIAHGLTLSPKEIDKERPVILEEARARRDAAQRLLKKQISFLAPNSRIARRWPIGTEEVIRNAKPETFRAFYRKWYRPDTTTLLVCGDVDAATIELMIKKAFGSWKAEGPKPKTPAPGLSEATGSRFAVVSDPDSARAVAMFVRPVRVLTERTVGDLRRSLVEIMLRFVVMLRWKRLAAGGADFLQAAIDDQEIARTHDLKMALAHGAPAKWRPLVRALIREMQRLRQHGVEPREVAQVRGILKSQMEKYAAQSRTWNANKMLEEMFDALNESHTPMSVAEGAHWVGRLLPTIEKKDLDAKYAELYELEDGVVILTMPDRGAALPSAEELAAAVKEARTEAVGASSGGTSGGRLPEAAPAPGKIASSEDDRPWNVRTLTFENGAVVRIKPMATPGHVIVYMRLSGGSMEETAESRGLTEAAALALSPGSMAGGGLSSSDVTSYVLGLKAGVTGQFQDDNVVLAVQGGKDKLVAGLRLLHHVLKTPTVEASAIERWKEVGRQNLGAMERQVFQRAIYASRSAVSGGDPRLVPPALARIEAITREAAQAHVDAFVARAPIDVAIIGDIDPAFAGALATAWIGSLPKRADRMAAIRAGRKVAAAKLPAQQVLEVETASDKAAVRLGWRGLEREDEVAEAALIQAGMILQARLLAEIREEKGLTYTVNCGYETLPFLGADSLVVQFTADPEKAAEAAALARRIVERFRDEGATADEAKATRSKIQHNLFRSTQAPGFWASILSSIRSDGTTLEGMRGQFRALANVDPERVKKAVAAIVKGERYFQVIARPKKR